MVKFKANDCQIVQWYLENQLNNLMLSIFSVDAKELTQGSYSKLLDFTLDALFDI